MNERIVNSIESVVIRRIKERFGEDRWFTLSPQQQEKEIDDYLQITLENIFKKEDRS